MLRRFGTIHSVDSLALAQRLQRIAAEEGLAPGILLQVKFRPDPAKTGFDPDEVRAQWPSLERLEPLRCLGLMTIAPLGLTPGGAARAVLGRAATWPTSWGWRNAPWG